jgi:hypothetical protein
MNVSYLSPLVRGAIVALLAVLVSLPLLFWIHSHFDLGKPPVSGIVLLSLGVMGACIGAAFLGWGIGRLMGRRASGTLAALAGFVWGAMITFSVASFYSGMITDEATRGAAMTALANRDRIAQSALETLDQARAGHASKAVESAGSKFKDGAVDVAIRGAAKLPAMSLLAWALLAPPLLSAFECRRARR